MVIAPHRISLVAACVLLVRPVLVAQAHQTESRGTSVRPETLWVGSPELSGARLTPYTNSWTLIFVDSLGARHAAGTVSDRLSFDSIRREVAVREQLQRAPNGTTVITRNEFDRKTLSPLARRFEISGRQQVTVRFDSRGASGSIDDGHGARSFSIPLMRKVFDFEGGMYGLLLRGLPLEAGYATTIATLAEHIDAAAGPRNVHFVSVRVAGRERVPAGHDALVDTWRVEATAPDMGTLIFWLADDAPYIIRAQAPVAGGIATYEMS